MRPVKSAVILHLTLNAAPQPMTFEFCPNDSTVHGQNY
jgi:hypothetical protein